MAFIGQTEGLDIFLGFADTFGSKGLKQDSGPVVSV